MLRFEHKYLMPESLLAPLRRLVARFARPDSHASRAGNVPWMSYTVRSIYFDSSRFTNYFETEDGLPLRDKPRIRGYGRHLPGGEIFLEIKRRRGAAGFKDRAPLAFEMIQPLLAGGEVGRLVQPNADFPDAVAHARNFLFHLRRDALHPVLLVVYDREAYVGMMEPSLRLTFDQSLRSVAFPSVAGLFEERGTLGSLARRAILEVKYDVAFGFPSWLRPFIAEHGLVRQALSKYWTCATDQRVVQAATRIRALA